MQAKWVIQYGVGTTEQAITLPNQLESVKDQVDEILDLAESIVKISVIQEEARREVACTGFLMSSRHFVTAGHCLSKKESSRSRQIDSMFVEFGFLEQELQHSQPAEVEDCQIAYPEDVAVCFLRDSTPRRTLEWFPGGFPEWKKGMLPRLLLLQHPEGGEMKISIRDCRMVERETRIRTATASVNFEHSCDTLAGSSGSPVLDFRTRKVIGIHRAGFHLQREEYLNLALNHESARAAELQVRDGRLAK